MAPLPPSWSRSLRSRDGDGDDNNSSLTVGLPIGLGAGFLILVVILVFAYLFYRRRTNTQRILAQAAVQPAQQPQPPPVYEEGEGGKMGDMYTSLLGKTKDGSRGEGNGNGSLPPNIPRDGKQGTKMAELPPEAEVQGPFEVGGVQTQRPESGGTTVTRAELASGKVRRN